MGKEEIIILSLFFLVFLGVFPTYSLLSESPPLVGAYVSPESGEVRLINMTHMIVFSVPKFIPYTVCVDYSEKIIGVGGSYRGFPAFMSVEYTKSSLNIKLTYLEGMKGRLYDVKCGRGGFLGGGYVEYGEMYKPLIINITSLGVVTEVIDLTSHSYIRELIPNSREILAVGGMYYLGSYKPLVIYRNASYTLLMLEGLSLTNPVVRGILEKLSYVLVLDDEDVFLIPVKGGDMYRLCGIGGVKSVERLSLLDLDLFVLRGENAPSWVLDTDLRCYAFQSNDFVTGYNVEDESIYAVSYGGRLKEPVVIKECGIIKAPEISVEIVKRMTGGVHRVETVIESKEIHVNFTAIPLSESIGHTTTSSTNSTQIHSRFSSDVQTLEPDYVLLIAGIVLLFLGIFFHFNFKEK